MTATQTKPFAQLVEAVIAAFNAAEWEQLRTTVAADVVYLVRQNSPSVALAHKVWR